VRKFSLAALVLLMHHAASAQRPVDTVFVVPGSHLDLGFTGPISAVRLSRIRTIDQAIEAATADPSFVWFEEGGWSVEQWLDQYHNDPKRIARLRSLVMANRIGIGATLMSPYAAAFPDALRLLTLHLDRIQRELGRRPTVAVINDVPAIPETIVDALAAAGIHYLLMGTNRVFSSPLPPAVTSAPFYWESAKGARVLASIGPSGYSTGLMQWLLPPDCVRFFDPQHFPATMSDDSILTLGVGREVAERAASQPLTIVQHALDNNTPGCALHLDAAAARWNARKNATKLVIATPEIYFRHLEQRQGKSLRVLHGEWGGDWDLLRASEPVWSWRLREAMRTLKPDASRALRIAAATATDHNVGLGPRWQDGSAIDVARAHIAEVAQLYRNVVSGAMGEAALKRVPTPITPPVGNAWPAAWRQILGEQRDAARVRAGPAFIYPFVDDAAPTAAVPLSVIADEHRLVLHAVIDRVALERTLGPRYQAVIEITIEAPIGSLTISPDSSRSGLAGKWLLGTPAQRIVAPEGVRIAGPGFTIHAHGPLLIGWTLRADPKNPGRTRLQALAVVHAVEGTISNGQKLRLPFGEMYPGEPPVPAFDLEIIRER